MLSPDTDARLDTGLDARLWLDAEGNVLDATADGHALFRGAPPSAWVADGDRTAAAAIAARLLGHEVEQAGLQVVAPDGAPVWIDLRRDPSDPARVVGQARPGRRYTPDEAGAQTDRLRLLATVTGHGGQPFRERLQRALRLTSELLGLEVAIVSRIEGETYTVYDARTPDGALAPGDQFALGDTFCSVTIEGNGVFAVDGIGQSRYRTHPCYRVFALESYVGVCVEVHGERWGTLTFSSAEPLGAPLAQADRDLVRLLALWIGGEIGREEDRRALAESERRYRALSRATFEGIAFSQGGTVLDCNSQFAALLGYDRVGDVVGRPMRELVAPGSLDTVATMIRENRSEPYEARLLRRGRRPFWAEVQGREWTLEGERVRVTAIRDVSERRALSEQLEYQATHDSLTGLPNRALFYARVEGAIAAGAPFAALFLDLDRFKVVNDSLGHETGDFLLATVAERLRGALGGLEGATVARLGGDEFGVVVPTGPDEGAAGARGRSGLDVAEALLETLNQPVDLGPRRHEPGASAGVVERAERYATPEEVVRDADTAMYAAKRAGRGRAAVFGATMREAATHRFRLEHDLRRAIADGELRVHLQPVVALETGAVAGFESLVRWEHPTRGLLGPDAFLPLAEELGLVQAIDEWILDATLEALEAGPRGRAEALVWLSINCSDTTFLSGGLRDRVRRAVRRSGLAPSQVVLELTERAIVAPDDARAVLTALHDEGVQVCIDDFGTGFSSLSLLHALPVDGLKVDRSFVTDLETSPSARAVVEGVIGVARTLGLRVVAEGVETESQRALLADLGCELAQGYLFSRPLPAAEALALLE